MSTFRFRKKTEYGMMMLARMAREERGKVVSVRLMQECGLPRSFLVKIARDLIGANLVRAKEGRGGGYSLVSEPSKITLKQVIEAIEGQVATVPCLIHKTEKCPMEEKCRHKTTMTEVTEKIGRVLEEYHLSDIC